MKHTFNITITAASEAEATKKMQALTVLASRLTENELTKLAHIIQNEPQKTALAKKALGV